jgi:flagellar basal-body rod protein FlgC
MSDPLQAALKVASSGLTAQSTRLRVVAENLANAQSTGKTAGADPYTRKAVHFESVLDERRDADLVAVEHIGLYRSPYRVEYDPGHPAADARGFVKLPNVDPLVELADMREATRSYSANVQAIRQAREMAAMTLDLLKPT